MKRIYLDYAASTPVSDRVMAVMLPYFQEDFANPSALHLDGQASQAAVDTAREDIATVLACGRKDIIFTASATESINLALRGVVKATKQKNGTPHIVTTQGEHPAVLETCADLEKDGVEVTYLPVNKDGLVTPEHVRGALQENTVLVSVMYAGNEIGVVQPVAAIAEELARYQEETGHRVFFHSDAVQAANYLDCSVRQLGVDLMTLSSQKIYGPKGAALLYKKEDVALAPLVTGGPQEHGLRAGTENVAAIIGFAEAIKETDEMRDNEAERVTLLRERFLALLEEALPSIELNGPRKNRLSNNLNLCFPGVASETLVARLDGEGIRVSSGSACTSRTPEPSHVIEALGKKECATQSIRFTLGRYSTEEEVEHASRTVIQLVQALTVSA